MPWGCPGCSEVGDMQCAGCDFQSGFSNSLPALSSHFDSVHEENKLYMEPTYWIMSIIIKFINQECNVLMAAAFSSYHY